MRFLNVYQRLGYLNLTSGRHSANQLFCRAMQIFCLSETVSAQIEEWEVTLQALEKLLSSKINQSIQPLAHDLRSMSGRIERLESTRSAPTPSGNTSMADIAASATGV